MNKVIRFPEIANKSKEETIIIKEEKQMKTSNITRISEIAKKYALRRSGALLMALAALFASAPCVGHFYEPEVPRKLKGER